MFVLLPQKLKMAKGYFPDSLGSGRVGSGWCAGAPELPQETRPLLCSDEAQAAAAQLSSAQQFVPAQVLTFTP